MPTFFYFDKSVTVLAIALSLGCLLGCSRIADAPKVLWGSSTRALEEARPQAFHKDYPCNLGLCFEDVLEVARKHDLEVFISDRKKGLIVLMGFQGSVNTTEVGIFFSHLGPTQTKIEVVSLSPQAQQTAAKMLVSALDKLYTQPKVLETTVAP